MRATVTSIQRRWAETSTADLSPEDLLKYQEQLQRNNAALAYIRNLGATCDVNISRWNILPVFGIGDGTYNLKEDPRVLNRAFFVKCREEGVGVANAATPPPMPTTPAQVPVIPPALREAFIAGTIGIRSREIQRHKEELRYVTADLRSYEANIVGKLAAIIRLNGLISALEGAETKETLADRIVQELQEVLSAGNWCDVIVENNIIWLRTARDINLSDFRRAAGVNQQFNLGQFAVSLNLLEGKVRVVPYKNNLRARGDTYHPHIDPGSGRPCWGSAQEASDGHIMGLKVKELLTLLYNLLSSYSDDNPYVHLGEYATATAFGRRTVALRCPYIERDAREAALAEQAVPLPAPALSPDADADAEEEA